jgi:hypothetical protein
LRANIENDWSLDPGNEKVSSFAGDFLLDTSEAIEDDCAMASVD